MSKQHFHETEFDDATRLKLDIFRGYVREWIPVFLTKYQNKKNYKRICIFDLFSGHGTDGAKNFGSPLLIYEELKKYCKEHIELKSPNIQTDLFFNDSNTKHIKSLEKRLSQERCQNNCCNVHLFNRPFSELLEDDEIKQPLESGDTACLVIMDQFGVKEVDRTIFRFFAQCPVTDIMFFISSAHVKRFAGESSFNTRLPIDPVEIKKTDNKNIHRKLCESYKKIIPANTKYYLAPFSILKGKNIYGVIFGSGELLGLEKFLTVTWGIDKGTGEANYDIDNDPIRKNQGSKLLFGEMNTYKKCDAFAEELKETLISNSMDNLQLYSFCLGHGFLPKHVRECLNKWSEVGILDIVNIQTNVKLRKGSYYIGWDYFNKNDRKLMFRIKE
ncbi:MAG: three-Cys-motif partner protein TcmP [Planctomycetaceae bacterium]|jgi:three-Cys-motif partner protein|nr:three-Cys-motif partner protein TcmP [Planctomycetaceae bacterium]